MSLSGRPDDSEARVARGPGAAPNAPANASARANARGNAPAGAPASAPESALPNGPLKAPPGAPLAPVPRSMAAAKSADADLDTQILHIEQRLILREENMRRSARHLTTRVQHALRPARMLWPLAGTAAAVAAGFGLYMLWRGRSGPAPSASGPSAPQLAAESSAMSWVRLIPLAWPLLPKGWRARVSPATASAVMSLGLPILEGLLSRGRPAAALKPMAKVDLTRFSGTWYVVASLPAHGMRAVAQAAQGTPGAAEAQASELPAAAETSKATRAAPAASRWNFALRRDGLLDLTSDDAADAVMLPVPGSSGAQFKMTRWPDWLRLLPWAWQDQWVLHVDADHSEAVLGSPNRRELRLLSRHPSLPEPRLAALVQMAHDRDFAVDRLQFYSPN